MADVQLAASHDSLRAAKIGIVYVNSYRNLWKDAGLPGRDNAGEWVKALLLAVAIAVVAALVVTRFGVKAALGLPVLALLVFGPSRLMLSVFLAAMVTDHQFRSWTVVPFGGVEWHPRELLLFVLFAHLAVRFLRGKADLRPDMMHYFFYVYAAFFVFIAWRGVLRQPNLQAVAAECRYPLFLGSYFVFVACVDGTRDLRYYLRLVFWLSFAIAIAGIGLFVYTLVTGNVINTQNVLGEYVRRQIGPYLLQSVRPNGHLFFEVIVVVLAGMLFCPEESLGRKLWYIPVIAVFLFAILITMMRTSYVTLGLSLGILILLHLRREVQGLSWYLGALLLAAAVAAFALHLDAYLIPYIPGDDASLRGRLVETEGALGMFRREPFLGAGMGSTFEGMGFVAKATLQSVAQTDYQTVHNVWIYYLFKGGLLGMLLVGVGLGGIVFRSHQIIRALPSKRDQFFMRGLLAALIGQYIASLAMPRLTYPSGGVFLSMMACAFVVMARKHTFDRAVARSGASPQPAPDSGHVA